MLFSSRVKGEPSRQVPATKHCQIAETAAILGLCGRMKISASDHSTTEIHTENVAVTRKYFTLLKKTSNISTDVSIRGGRNLSRNRTYIVAVRERNDTFRILQAVKPIGNQGRIRENLSLVRNVVVQNVCCKGMFIREAFLASGSISDSEKFYHLETTCSSTAKAKQLKGITTAFDTEPKIMLRKKCYVVYIKEGN